jgi:hypothetical protein
MATLNIARIYVYKEMHNFADLSLCRFKMNSSFFITDTVFCRWKFADSTLGNAAMQHSGKNMYHMIQRTSIHAADSVYIYIYVSYDSHSKQQLLA